MRFVPLLLVLSALSTGPTHAQPTIFLELYGGDLVDALVGSYAPSSVLCAAASKDTLYAVVDRVTVDGQDGAACREAGRPGGAGAREAHGWS